MHEDIWAVMDEFNTLFPHVRHILQKPAGKHSREHDIRFGIARFLSPDIPVLFFQLRYVFCRPAVQIIDIRGQSLAVFIYAGNTTDNAIAHDGPYTRW